MCASAYLAQYSCCVSERDEDRSSSRKERNTEKEIYIPGRDFFCDITGIVFIRTCLYPVDFRVYVSFDFLERLALRLICINTVFGQEKNKTKKRTCFFSFSLPVSRVASFVVESFVLPSPRVQTALRSAARGMRRKRKVERNQQKGRDGRRARVARYG